MRQDQFSVTVSVANKPLGTFSKMTGGEADSDETKFKPGGMAAHVSLGGSVEIGNVTVTRLEDAAELVTNTKWLIGQVGKGKCTVTKQPLDADGHAFGDPLVYTGTLKTVKPTEHDASSSDAGELELEISVSGTVS